MPNPVTKLSRRNSFPPIYLHENADGVGFKTMCYYLIINTIKDLYCAVLRENTTTCNLAVTNCHGIYLPYFQSKILPKLPSPFEIEVISIRPTGLEFLCEAQIQSIVERVARMGGGRSEGANPGPPYSHPFHVLMAIRSERVISPLPRKQSATRIGDYRIYWGLVED